MKTTDDTALKHNQSENSEEEEESDYDLLLRSKKTIEDLTEELRKEKLKTAGLETEIQRLTIFKLES